MTERKDHWRLAYHLMPPDGWLNDPNGLCQANGIYHIYFQYAPNTPAPNGKKVRTWGHYAGRDLISLDFLGIPFWPEKEDRDGCYSGSAFVKDGEINLFYTGNIKIPGDYDYIHDGREANEILIRTKDGKTYGEKKVLFGTKDYPKHCTRHVRDPKVWERDGIYYMVLGARMDDDSGAVLFYESKDLESWSLLKIVSTNRNFGYMWECPDYFSLDGQDVLSICPQGLPEEEYRFQNNHQSGYFLVSGNLRGAQAFKPFLEWDYGFDFYAPQTFEDEGGRRILIGWSGLPDKPYENPTAERGWENCLTVPRVLKLKGEVITQNPVEELKKLRHGEQEINPDGGIFSLEKAAGDIEIRFANGMFAEHSAWDIMIGEGVCLSYSNGVLALDMSDRAGRGRKERRVKVSNIRNARLMIDRSMLEFFFNDGEIAMASHYFPDTDDDPSLNITFQCPGAQITGWQMNSLPFNEQYEDKSAYPESGAEDSETEENESEDGMDSPDGHTGAGGQVNAADSEKQGAEKPVEETSDAEETADKGSDAKGTGPEEETSEEAGPADKAPEETGSEDETPEEAGPEDETPEEAGSEEVSVEQTGTVEKSAEEALENALKEASAREGTAVEESEDDSEKEDSESSNDEGAALEKMARSRKRRRGFRRRHR